MTLAELTLLAAAVLLLTFWIVGAATRVKRLRQAIVTAWGQLEEVLARRSAALDTLLTHLREPLAAEMGTLQALAQAQAVQQEAARAVRTQPGARAAALDWVAAEAAMASPMARLLALLDHHPEATADAQVQPQLRLLQEQAARIAYARQVFNEAVAAHNAAIAEAPTRTLARAFGWTPATPI